MLGVKGEEGVGPPLGWAGMEWSNSGIGKGQCILSTQISPALYPAYKFQTSRLEPGLSQVLGYAYTYENLFIFQSHNSAFLPAPRTHV